MEATAPPPAPTPLGVMLDRRIHFFTRDDLPADFRRAIAADNTMDNLPAAKDKGPEKLQLWTHNPFSGEVTLPRSYWPQFLARAREHGVTVEARDVREGQAAPVHRAGAFNLHDLPWACDVLHRMVAAAVPGDWREVNVQVIVTPYRPLAETDKPFPRQLTLDVSE